MLVVVSLENRRIHFDIYEGLIIGNEYGIYKTVVEHLSSLFDNIV